LKKENKIGNNKLIFANKSKEDIILEDEFQSYLGENFINILENGNEAEYEHGRITESFLRKHINNFNCKFYICGPPPMMDAAIKQLSNLGVAENSMIKEEF
jgi:NAD(P)H-flavin reductase